MRCVWSGSVKLAVVASFALGASSASPRPARAAEDAVWDAASSLAASPAPRGLRLVQSDVPGDPAAAIDRLERAGFRVAVSLPPRLFFVRGEGPGGEALPAGFAFAGAAPGPRESAAPPGDEAFAADPFGGREDALPPAGATAESRPRVARAASLQGLPYGARWTDTSEFMIGRVAISILLPESDGSIDPNHFDWTPALRDSVVRSAVRGLAKWSGFAAARGVPLSFAIETHAGLATGYEPIDRTVAEEDGWIQDALVSLTGYRSDVLTLSYDVANAARARLGAQWSVLVFAVQNDTSATGTFADGIIAHARLGGPYFVIPVNNLNTTSATLDYYMEHELAHAFWALDEHFPSTGWWACQLTTGYLNQPNFNSVVPAPGYCGYRRGCLMYANQPDSLCLYTERQIGWVDREGNGVPDLLETRATALPDSDNYRAVAGPPITLKGHAVEGALPNQNPYHYFYGDTISIATVDSVLCRVDGGDPLKAVPSDGVFDSGLESFSVVLPPLDPGEHTAEWEAWNSNGLPSINKPITYISLRAPSSPTIATAGGSGPSVASLRVGPSPSAGAVRVSLEAPPGSTGWAIVYDIQGRAVARQRLEAAGSGVVSWLWDARVPGRGALSSGLYFVRVEWGGAELTGRFVIAR